MLFRSVFLQTEELRSKLEVSEKTSEELAEEVAEEKKHLLTELEATKGVTEERNRLQQRQVSWCSVVFGVPLLGRKRSTSRLEWSCMKEVELLEAGCCTIALAAPSCA